MYLLAKDRLTVALVPCTGEWVATVDAPASTAKLYPHVGQRNGGQVSIDKVSADDVLAMKYVLEDV